jgi:hypothetical protein
LAHTQGKRHQTNLARRGKSIFRVKSKIYIKAAKEAKDMPFIPQPYHKTEQFIINIPL